MDIRKQIYVLLCCLVFSCLSTSVSPLDSPNGEVIALMGIKSFLVDPNGVVDNWGDSFPDPCSWNRVTCSSDGLVRGLGASSQNLSGTLAPTIGNLANLQVLQNNNISGNVPSEIGSLSKLQILDLSNNNFSGQILSILSDLKSLQHLDLSFNNLSGKVPMFPAKTFSIVGNPYLCSNGIENVGCAAERDPVSLLSSSSSKAKMNHPPGNYKSGIFFVIPMLMVSYSLDIFSAVNVWVI